MTNKEREIKLRKAKKELLSIKKDYDKLVGRGAPAKKYPPSKSKTATAVFKKASKKTIGKSVAKGIPYVGAAIIAHDVIKGVSKATCGRRGGKWVSGKCVGVKKTKFKPGAKVKDPISKR
jgi:hypothetical protein